MIMNMLRALCLRLLLGPLLLGAARLAAQDFAGTWTLDEGASAMAGLPARPAARLMVTQTNAKWLCTGCGPGGWAFTTDRRSTESSGAGHRNSVAAKWQGETLMVNAIVHPVGRAQYVLMDRWKLSRDGGRLTITREVDGVTGESTLVYRREGFVAGVEEAKPEARSEPKLAAKSETKPDEAKPEDARPEPEKVLEAGARLPLRSLSAFSSKTAQEGDRVYLETAQPVARFGQVLLPIGTQVTATVTFAKPAGRVKGRGEMMLRFETLITPGGVTKDFRAAATGADAEAGTVDKEGKIQAPGDKAGDAGKIGKTTATGAAIGAGVGGVTGLGIGAAAGAAAGLARVLGGRGPDVSIGRGDLIEMSLDREVRFTAAELPGARR